MLCLKHDQEGLGGDNLAPHNTRLAMRGREGGEEDSREQGSREEGSREEDSREEDSREADH